MTLTGSASKCQASVFPRRHHPLAPLGYPQVLDRSARLAAFAKWRLTYPPGTELQFHLASAAWVIGELCGRLTGQPIAQYLREVLADGVPDYQATALGGKAVGEHGIVGVAAAIGNTVFHATGRRVRDLPITLEKLV